MPPVIVFYLTLYIILSTHPDGFKVVIKILHGRLKGIVWQYGEAGPLQCNTNIHQAKGRILQYTNHDDGNCS